LVARVTLVVETPMGRRALALLSIAYFLLGALSGFAVARSWLDERGCALRALPASELAAHLNRVAVAYAAQPTLQLARCLLQGFADAEIAQMAEQLAMQPTERGNTQRDDLARLALAFGSTNPELLARCATVVIPSESAGEALATPRPIGTPVYAVLRSQLVCLAEKGSVVTVLVRSKSGEELPGQRVCLVDAAGTVRDCSITGLKDPASPGRADMVLDSSADYYVILLDEEGNPVSPLVELAPAGTPCPSSREPSFTVEFAAVTEPGPG
jgi:hypothetical protein